MTGPAGRPAAPAAGAPAAGATAAGATEAGSVGPALQECVVNVSEGRSPAVIASLAAACGDHLLDVHSDADHHRSVFTLAGEPEALQEAVRSLASAVVDLVSLAGHEGVHPRIGALDVVPFVALVGEEDGVRDGSLAAAVASRDRFAEWAGKVMGLPCFLYGPQRSLPEVRREAWRGLAPDFGPTSAHPSAGACAVGARPALVAYNLWLEIATRPDGFGGGIDEARSVVRALREAFAPNVRALALQVGRTVQVSCNLIAPWVAGPGVVFDFVASRSAVERCELVGLIPRAILLGEPSHRWAELGLDPSATIEARLESAGLDGGSFHLHG